MTTVEPVVAVWRSEWLPPSETFVRDHVRALSRYRPVLLGLTAVDDRLGIRPHVAPFPSHEAGRRAARLSRRLGHPLLYARILRRTRPALLHAHFGTDATQCLGIVDRHRLPFAVTFHGYDATAAVRRDDSGVYRNRLRQVFERATALLPVSEFLAGRLRDLGAPEDKLRVHYLGIPRADTPPAVARNDTARPRRKSVVFVGRLVDGKGVDRLIEAYAALDPALRESTDLHVLGDGDLRGELERRAAGVHGHVHFHGRVAPTEVSRRLSEATVFAGLSHPTTAGWDEGLGLVFLEASRAGLPVVASRTGGIPEAVLDGRTGLLATPGETREVTAHLDRLLRDGDLAARLGNAGRERVARDFALDTQTTRLERIYDDVVDHPVGAPGRRSIRRGTS